MREVELGAIDLIWTWNGRPSARHEQTSSQAVIVDLDKVIDSDKFDVD